MAYLSQTPQQDINQAAQDVAAKASQVGWVIIAIIVLMLIFFSFSSSRR